MQAKLIEKLQQEVFSLQQKLDSANKLPQPSQPKKSGRKIDTVTICDEQTGICEEKAIPEHIDVEATMPKACDVQEVVLGGGKSKNIVVCNKDEVEERKKKKKPVEKKTEPGMKTITICNENTLECEESQVPVSAKIKENLPDNCKIE